MADYEQPPSTPNPLAAPAPAVPTPDLGHDAQDYALMKTAPPPLGEPAPAGGGGILGAIQALFKGNEANVQNAQNAGMVNPGDAAAAGKTVSDVANVADAAFTPGRASNEQLGKAGISGAGLLWQFGAPLLGVPPEVVEGGSVVMDQGKQALDAALPNGGAEGLVGKGVAAARDLFTPEATKEANMNAAGQKHDDEVQAANAQSAMDYQSQKNAAAAAQGPPTAAQQQQTLANLDAAAATRDAAAAPAPTPADPYAD